MEGKMMKGPEIKVKKVRFDEYYRNNRIKYTAMLCSFRNAFKTRSVRERPRDELEERLILALDKKRRQRMMASGELVRIGERHWALKIF